MTIKVSSVKKLFILAVSTSVFLFGIFVTLNSRGLRYALTSYILISLFQFVVLWLIGEHKIKLTYSSSIDQCMILFCLSVFISGLVNFNSYSIVSSITGMVIWLIIKSIPYETYWNYYEVFAVAYCISVAITYRIYSIREINSEGCIIALLGIIVLNAMCKRGNTKYSIYIIISALTIILITLTRARTPLLTFLAVDVITYFYLYSKNKSIKKLLVFVLSIVVASISTNYLISILNQYFLHKWNNTDLTSARADYWKLLFRNANAWGHGMDIGSTVKGFKINAHNSWVQVLGCFGIIAFILFILFSLNVLRRILKSNNKILYINFFVGWFAMSMFEDLSIFSSRYVPIVVFFYIHIAMLIKETDVRYEHECNKFSIKTRG